MKATFIIALGALLVGIVLVACTLHSHTHVENDTMARFKSRRSRYAVAPAGKGSVRGMTATICARANGYTRRGYAMGLGPCVQRTPVSRVSQTRRATRIATVTAP